jgi:hypothetical protein
MNYKAPLYQEQLRIPEYFLFDPTGDYLKPRLQGFRIVDGRSVPLEVVDGRLHSEMLGLDLVTRGEDFRFYDPVTGETLPTRVEERQRADRARAAAEAEVARLRALLEQRDGTTDS